MKKILILVLCLFVLFPGLCRAQFPTLQVVQGNSSHGTGGTTCTMSVTSGDYIIAGFSWFASASTPSVSDTVNTYTSRIYNNAGPGGLGIAIYTATASTTASITISASVSGSGEFNFVCSEHPPSFSLTVDVSTVTNFTGSPATATSGNITPTLNTDFVYAYIGGFRNAGRFATGTGYNNIGFVNGDDCGAAEFKNAGAASVAVNASFGNASNDQGMIAVIAFKSNSLAITSPSVIPDGSLTNSYDYTMLAAGGVGSYTWSITSGALQSGLSLNTSTGEITGTPTSSSNATITFQVTDGTNTATKAVALKVGATANTISVLQTVPGAGGDGILIFGSNVTAGSLIAVVGGYDVGANRAFKCTDTRGTVYLPVLLQPLSNNGEIEYLLGVAPSSGADTVSCSSNTNGARIAWEIANAQNFGDNTNYLQASTASPITSSSLTTLVPNSIILSTGMGFTGTSVLTISSPFTSVNGAHNTAGGYDIVTSVTGYTSTYTMTSNTSGLWLISMLGLRPSASAPAPPTAVKHRIIQP